MRLYISPRCNLKHGWFLEMPKSRSDRGIAGIAVVCERYVWSGVVYSAASDQTIPLKAFMFCDQGIVQPDIVVLLNTPVQEARRSPKWSKHTIFCQNDGISELDFGIPKTKKDHSGPCLKRSILLHLGPPTGRS